MTSKTGKANARMNSPQPITPPVATEPAIPADELFRIVEAKVVENGEGLNFHEVLSVLQLDDEHLDTVLDLAHQVRLKWCGEDVEVEGIISLKTGGCPEDCHFCAQSGLFDSPVRSVTLDIPSLIEAAKQTAKTGATEFCIVAAVKGPTESLMVQLENAVSAIQAEIEINVAASVGILTQEQVNRLKKAGIHRYNHNLETSRSYFPQVVTTHTWEERISTLEMVRDAGMEVCCGGIVGMGESVAQRAEFAMDLQELAPAEVPMNFFDPRPGTPFANLQPMDVKDALRTIAAFRLALPRTILRFAGGRELTLGDLGAEQGLLGGINAIIVGNYLTTLGRPAEKDIDMLGKMQLPIKALNATL